MLTFMRRKNRTVAAHEVPNRDFFWKTIVLLGWSVPVTILLCTLVGYYIGKKVGLVAVGLVVGWLLGMVVVMYDIWKLDRRNSRRR